MLRCRLPLRRAQIPGHLCATLRTARFSVQPVNTSVAVRVLANSLAGVGASVDDHGCFDEPWGLFVFVPAFGDGERVAQQRHGLSRGQALGFGGTPGWAWRAGRSLPRRLPSAARLLPGSAASCRVRRRPEAWAATGPLTRTRGRARLMQHNPVCCTTRVGSWKPPQKEPRQRRLRRR